MIHYFAIFFLSILIPLSFSSAFGAVENFTTDRSLYHNDDQLNISGNVSYDPENTSITIIIFNPGKSTFVHIEPAIASPSGGFSASIHVGGPTWATDGIYPIQVTYMGSSLEKSIEYKKLSTTTSESNPEPSTKSSSNTKPSTEPSSNPEPSTEPTTKSKPRPSFIDPEKDPYHYIDRYNNEATYKEWFDENYPDYTIKEAVGIPESIPGWIKDNAKGWAEGQIDESDFVSGIEYMVKEKIIYIPDLSLQASATVKETVPDWIKNNAKWWVDEQIDEDDFLNSMKFLIQEGIIDIN